jgi:hypothetical protein
MCRPADSHSEGRCFSGQKCFWPPRASAHSPSPPETIIRSLRPLRPSAGGKLPALVFQSSDPEPDARLSIAAWVKATGVTNVCAPIALDVSHSVWPIASADGSICTNMIRVEAYWRPARREGPDPKQSPRRFKSWACNVPNLLSATIIATSQGPSHSCESRHLPLAIRGSGLIGDRHPLGAIRRRSRPRR